ncbi:MAG: uroporphyrinogen decarboxylase family protein, partial [bacterium]
MDYEKHNQEVQKVWEAFNKGKPFRVPIVFNFNPRFYLLTPWLNEEGYTFEQYIKDPEIMMRVQLKLKKWIRLNIPQDMEMGYPKDNWGGVYVDLQNFYEAGWLGDNVVFPEEDVPYAAPLPRERIEEIIESGIP